MRQITLRVTENVLRKIQQYADEKKLTVTDYLLAKAVPGYLDEVLTVDKVLDKIKTINEGETFSLKDLFSHDEWNRFTPGSRISTGRLFYQAYEKNHYNLKEIISFERKNSANLALYKKLKKKGA